MSKEMFVLHGEHLKKIINYTVQLRILGCLKQNQSV